MEKVGFVSLWVGSVESSEKLEELLSVSYSDKGEFIPSIFAKYFKIARYDDAVREAEYYEEENNNLKQLLEGFSYDEVLIPKFTAIVQGELLSNFNVVVLLYNFQYTGSITEAIIETGCMKFLGAVKYQ